MDNYYFFFCKYNNIFAYTAHHTILLYRANRNILSQIPETTLSLNHYFQTTVHFNVFCAENLGTKKTAPIALMSAANISL